MYTCTRADVIGEATRYHQVMLSSVRQPASSWALQGWDRQASGSSLQAEGVAAKRSMHVLQYCHTRGLPPQPYSGGGHPQPCNMTLIRPPGRITITWQYQLSILTCERVETVSFWHHPAARGAQQLRLRTSDCAYSVGARVPTTNFAALATRMSSSRLFSRARAFRTASAAASAGGASAA